MEEIDYNDDSKEGKLRRWVANLQLESWQLELLITGFSIFLLASGYSEYEDFRRNTSFNKLVIANDSSIIVSGAGRFILNTIPTAFRFFLISLLLHLLLRGFWIGIVGLSSVSNVIDFEKLKLKGPFRKYIPNNVRSLDDLIFYVDQISSVIFAYTYLLVFSIISVVLVASFLFLFIGLFNVIPAYIDNTAISALLVFLVMILALILLIGAVLFFIDSLFFSVFKKSKWFSIIFYPVYRFYSALSLAFIYRSIYYHLITNFKKKQIITVTGFLLLFAFLADSFESWDRYTFFPNSNTKSENVLRSVHYDDEREDSYIYDASIPSKIIKGNFLPLFIRYSPQQNVAIRYFCPEIDSFNEEINFSDGFKAGVQSQSDTSKIESALIKGHSNSQIRNGLDCIQQVYEVYLDNEMIENDFVFTQHSNKQEKGFLQMIDILGLTRGRHVITVKRQEYRGNVLIQDIEPKSFKMDNLIDIVFWKE